VSTITILPQLTIQNKFDIPITMNMQ